jgi:hypothetical protein
MKPLCEHPEGRWQQQVVEEPYWVYGELHWRSVRRWFWRCETCRGTEKKENDGLT